MIERALTFLPEDDAVTHINISMTGKTELGRMLSHFYYSPFVHPYFGPFYSMEGFWYYVRAKEKDDKLRTLSGMNAKRHGVTLKTMQLPMFKEIVMEANFYKVVQNEKITARMIESSMPFDQYYLFGVGKVQIRPKYHEWLVEGFERIRELVKEGKVPEPLDYSALLTLP